MKKKKCTECGKVKDLKLFHRNKLKKDGRATKCAKCLNGAGRQATKEKMARKEIKIRIPNNKIICNRDNKQIFKKDCIPGCNDACKSCDNPQTKNIKSGGNPVTLEEDKEMLYAGIMGGQYGRMVEESL